MKARVKNDYRWNVVRACGGAEFVKEEWRPVPPGMEEEAENNPLLDTEDGTIQLVVPKPSKKAPGGLAQMKGGSA